MRVLSSLGFLAVAALALGGCVTTQSASDAPIDAVQAGDQNLSCDELKTEMTRMDSFIRESERVEAERQKNQAADTATSTAVGGVVPFGGLFHAMAVSQPRGAEWINARERGGQAARRKEHLAGLFNQKSCPPTRARS